MTWNISINPVRIWTTIVQALIPSFLHRPDHEGIAIKSTRSKSASLDGLRGLACLFVYNEHLTYNITVSFLLGWGVGSNHAWNSLPFIRVLWSGRSMVAIFFVISGYALSVKPLRHLQDERVESAYKALTSSMVRRAFRLFPPTFAAILITAVLVQFGAFNAAINVWNMKLYALHETPPARHPTFTAQIQDALGNCFYILNAWHWDSRSAYGYDLHTWTIPTEFRASMVLFLGLAALATMSTKVRMISICGLIAYSFFCERQEMMCFLSGSMIAAIDVNQDCSDIEEFSQRRRAARRNATSLLLLVVGLYLCSIPTIQGEISYGFTTISSIIPATFKEPAEYVRTVGAALTVHGVLHCRPLAWLFTNPLVTYLGRISFALYLVHGNVLKSVFHGVIPFIYSILGDQPNHMSTQSVVISWFIGLVLTLPLSVYLADIFTRLIDQPSISLARRFEALLVEDKEYEYKELPLAERVV